MIDGNLLLSLGTFSFAVFRLCYYMIACSSAAYETVITAYVK